MPIVNMTIGVCFAGKKSRKKGGIKRQINEVLTFLEFTLSSFPEHKCAEGDMKCADGIECISKHSMCNSGSDCNDGSDELEETCRGEILQHVYYLISFVIFNFIVVI